MAAISAEHALSPHAGRNRAAWPMENVWRARRLQREHRLGPFEAFGLPLLLDERPASSS